MVRIIIISLFLFLAGCSTSNDAQAVAIKAGYKILYSFSNINTIVEDSSGSVLLLDHNIAEGGKIKNVMVLKKCPCQGPEKSKENW